MDLARSVNKSFIDLLFRVAAIRFRNGGTQLLEGLGVTGFKVCHRLRREGDHFAGREQRVGVLC